MNEAWKKNANCRDIDTNMFFPGLGQPVPLKVRKACRECKVKEECLWYANESSASFGIFGGMSPNQRGDWRRNNKILLGDKRKS